MPRILTAALLALALCTTGCGPDLTAEQKLKSYLLRTERQSRKFVYEDDFGILIQGTLVRLPPASVEGLVEDDLRYHAILKMDEDAVMEQVVSDDALAIRLHDPSSLPPGVASLAALAGSQIIGNALAGGQWVLDYTGAPPTLAPTTRRGSIAVGINPILDASYIFQYVRRAIDEGARVWEFNKDSLEYKPSEDPFEIPDPNEGIKRFDIIAPELPRRSERGAQATLPTVAHFRKLSFYVKGERVIQIVERIDFEQHPEFLKAKAGKGIAYHLRVLDAIREGKTLEPIPFRDMSYEIVDLGKPVKVTLPPDALVANLGGVFGAGGLGSSFTDGALQDGGGGS